jgi:RNA polymerase sigma-70 factor, ECF subfamily
MNNGIALSLSATKAPSRSEAPTDEALIYRIAAGDQNAMRILFRRHEVRIYRFVQRLLGNNDTVTAEDIVSEVFLQVWRQAARFEGRSQVVTWLLAIARYKTLTAIRDAPAEQLDISAAAERTDPGEGPEAAAHRNDVSAILRKCLGQLSLAHREVIDLVYYHERTVAEAAAILNIPPNTVKTRMFYARKQLAQMLASGTRNEPSFEF